MVNTKIFGILLLGLHVGLSTAQVKVNYVKLSEGESYGPHSVRVFDAAAQASGKTLNVRIYPEIRFQTMKGIGGAFNEQGGEAFVRLSESKQAELVDALFGVEHGAGLSFCRTAVGASDFAFDAYSYSEVPNDYKMESFSIARDRKTVIPFIQAAMKANPSLGIFASPWSPPGWMKESGKMEDGRRLRSKNVLIDKHEIYEAYALYMYKYVTSYLSEGIPIERLLIQNEQDWSTVYPSCRIPVEQMVKFVDHYLYPLFKKKGVKTEIWGGTFRTVGELEALRFAADPQNAEHSSGMGVQYTRLGVLSEIRQLFPEVRLMHTESACFNGANSIEEAWSRFEEVSNYINNGCSNFCYWNMVLNEGQKSGWGWKQNSLITVDRNTQQIEYHPDYGVFLLMSRFIRPGMERIASITSGISMAFTDGKKSIYLLKTSERRTFPANVATVMSNRGLFCLPSLYV